MDVSNQKIETFLMFSGQAEEAMNFYLTQFPGSEVLSLKKYGSGDSGPEGKVEVARFTLQGQVFQCIDGVAQHGAAVTPTVSLYVNCADEEEIYELFHNLGRGGKVLMPLSKYPFSRKFGWVTDRYGVSWQLNLA